MRGVKVADVANQTVGNRKPDCPDETCLICQSGILM